MYLNKFSVRINGKSEESGYVEMKHGETYTIVLKNDHDVRCDASVEVDGKDVGTFRINSRSNLRLERPANEQKLFTFYQLGTSEADKSGLNKVEKNKMGLIKVIFKPEMINKPLREVHHPYNYDWIKPWDCGDNLNKSLYISTTIGSTSAKDLYSGKYSFHSVDTESLSDGGQQLQMLQSSISNNSSYGNDYMYDSEPMAGGTGLSGYSNQRFVEVSNLDYDTERITEIYLRLIPIKERRSDPVELKPVTKSTPIPPPLFVLL